MDSAGDNGQSGQRPLFFHRKMANGRFEMSVRLGEFATLAEAEKAAKDTMDDLRRLWSMDRVMAELATSTSLDGETIEQMTAQVQHEFCGDLAQSFGTADVWQQSQTWPNFTKAWESWRAAFYNWQCQPRRFPDLRGQALNRYLWEQQQFLANLRLGRGSNSDFYKAHDFFLFTAARLGDVEFFQQFAKIKRSRKNDPRLVQFHVMTQWMPMGLWSCQQRAVAKILQEKFEAWGKEQPADPANALTSRGESVRKTWENLKLFHDPDYRIRDWTKAGKPICRS
jgi:hypothetical protein